MAVKGAKVLSLIPPVPRFLLTDSADASVRYGVSAKEQVVGEDREGPGVAGVSGGEGDGVEECEEEAYTCEREHGDVGDGSKLLVLLCSIGLATQGVRNATGTEMYRALSDHRVTHMCCAPILFNILLEASLADCRPLSALVQVLIGGALPPAAMLERIERIERMGFHVTHAYDLTEATGLALVCEWRAEWDCLSPNARARMKAWQGMSFVSLNDVDVKDPETMTSFPLLATAAKLGGSALRMGAGAGALGAEGDIVSLSSYVSKQRKSVKIAGQN